MKKRKFLVCLIALFSVFLVNISCSLACGAGASGSTALCVDEPGVMVLKIIIVLLQWLFLILSGLSLIVLFISGIIRLVVKKDYKKVKRIKIVTSYAAVALAFCMIEYIMITWFLKIYS